MQACSAFHLSVVLILLGFVLTAFGFGKLEIFPLLVSIMTSCPGAVIIKIKTFSLKSE